MQKSNELARFQVGTVDAALDAVEMLEENGMTVEGMIRQHALGNWGDIALEFKRANDLAVERGCLVFSAHRMLFCDDHVLIVTLPDRSKTYIWRVPEN